MKTEVDVIEDVEEYQTVPGIITVIMRIIGDPSIVIQSFFYLVCLQIDLLYSNMYQTTK